MTDKNQTILITGANGCIGSGLVEKLLTTDNELILLDRNFANLGEYKNNPKLKFIKTDITDKESILDLDFDLDIIIHLAAKVHTKPKNQAEKEEFFTVNTKATQYLYQLAIKQEINHFIFISTISLYGSSTKGLVDETTKVNPQTPYAQSKYQAEAIGLELYQKKDLPITILRLATVYGRQDQGNYKKLIDFVKKGFVPFVGQGDYHKPIIYAEDVINAILTTLNQEASLGEVYLVADDNYSYSQIIKTMSQIFNPNLIRIKIPKFIVDLFAKFNLKLPIINKLITLSRNFEVDNTKMKEDLGFKAEYNLKAGLKDSARYYNN